MSAGKWIGQTIGQVVVLFLIWVGLYFYLDVYAPLSPADKDEAHWLALIGVVLVVAAWGIFLAILRAIGGALRGDK